MWCSSLAWKIKVSCRLSTTHLHLLTLCVHSHTQLKSPSTLALKDHSRSISITGAVKHPYGGEGSLKGECTVYRINRRVHSVARTIVLYRRALQCLPQAMCVCIYRKGLKRGLDVTNYMMHIWRENKQRRLGVKPVCDWLRKKQARTCS